MNVRNFFTLLMVVLLLSCPAMCRATEVACCPGHEVGECSDEPEQQTPAAPSDAGSCICSGTALKADDGHAGEFVPALPALLPETFEANLSRFLGALSRGNLLSDPDDWLMPVRLHVLLEVFRC